MVGTVGLEPTRDFSQRILSPLRLPISPYPQMEVPARFELAVTELQSIALAPWLRNHVACACL